MQVNRTFICFQEFEIEKVKSLVLVPSTVPLVPPSTTLPWTLADEEALTKRVNSITHLQLCIARRDQCEIDLINFCRKYSETVINVDPFLHSRHISDARDLTDTPPSLNIRTRDTK